MSNIYIQEPPTHGKVCLETSVGDIEIELWSRECPKACRNFVQLCMENYYNKTKFHRVVKDFIVQGGDPSGTGQGGDSIYGQPFKDEFHTRLRFVRRGLVAMANAGKDDNGSQFFFTMSPTQELQNKHTLFGKVVGDTIYNMIKLQEVEVDPDDRPMHPHKILRTKVLNNPFPDIEPRQSIQNLMDDDELQKEKIKKPKSKMKATKDYKLLSFGEEAEDDEEETLEIVQKSLSKKPKSSHDLLDDPTLCKDVGDLEGDVDYVKGDQKLDLDDDQESAINNVESIRDKLKKAKDEKSKKRKHEREADDPVDDVLEIPTNPEEEYEDDEVTKQKRRKEEIRKEIKALKKDLMKESFSDRNKSQEQKEDAKSKLQKLTEEEKANDLLLAFYAEKEKYGEKKKKILKKGSKREQQTMAILSNFKNKLFSVKTNENPTSTNKPIQDDNDDSDDDDNWMANSLNFESNDPVLAKDASTKDDDWFDIYDPRNPMNKRRRENDAKKSKK